MAWRRTSPASPRGSAPAISRSARCSAPPIYDAIAQGSGFFQHGHTYIGHPTAAAAGLAVVSAILERGLVPRVRAQGAALDERLRARFGQHAHVGDIRGRGLFRGIELVADRESKAPFDPARGLAAKVKKAAFAEGLICYPMAGTIDGRRGDHVLLAPPFIIEDAQLDELVDKLDAAIGPRWPRDGPARDERPCSALPAHPGGP
jgi:adenosylmethionine-8-amino-7-oxononanoate aminotransferase